MTDAEPTKGRRLAVRIGVLALIVAVVGAVAAAQLRWFSIPGGPLRGGADMAVSLPLKPGDKGVAWGNLLVSNLSDATIVLDKVTVIAADGDVTLLREPYVWRSDRIEIAGSGTLAAWQLPLPPKWEAVPKHPLAGYELRPLTEDLDGLGPEVVVELAPPTRVTTITGIRVDYHVGFIPYHRVFDSSLTICPSSAPGPCGP